MDLSEAGRQFGETSCWFNDAESYRTVWYRYVATTTSRIAAKIAGAPFNTRIAVYTGSHLKSLQTIRCQNGQGEKYPARAAWDPVIGETYYIKVGAAGGTIDVDISTPAAPPNNEIANAHVIDPSPPIEFEHVSEENAGADAVGEPRPTCVTITDRTPTTWYQLTAPAEGSPDFVYHGTGIRSSTYIALYEQQPDLSLTQLRCNFYSLNVRIRPKPDTTYYFQLIDVWEGGAPLGISIHPPLANDNFDEAMEVPAIPFAHSEDMNLSTLESDEPAPSCDNYRRGSVWFKYTSDADKLLEIKGSVPNASDYYSGWMAFYGESSIGSLKELGCTIVTSGRSMIAEVRQGETIYVQIGYDYLVANALTVSFGEAPAASNDMPHQAIDLAHRAILPSTFSTSTANARLSPDEPAPSCGSNPGSTSWFSITSPIAQRLSFSTGNYDTILAAYDTDLNEIACNDDVNATKFTSQVILEMQAGKKYLLSVSGTRRTRGPLIITVGQAPPVNDHFEAATQIPTPRYVDQQRTQGATLQSGEPQPPSSCIGATTAPTTISFTVWYRFTPQEDMSLTASVFGNNLQTLVAVYTGDQLDKLTSVACSGPTPEPAPGVTGVRVQAAAFSAQAGTTYYFQVGHRATVGQTAVPFQLNRTDGGL